jgi:hypothetical protein
VKIAAEIQRRVGTREALTGRVRLGVETAKALIAKKPDLQAYYSAIGIDDDDVNLSSSDIFADIDNSA